MMFHRILACCLFIGMASASISQEQALEAWWLKASFAANLTAYEGLDVSALNPEWARIGVLSYDVLPAEAHDDLPWMHEGRFAFAKEGNLSGKGFIDRAVTGVFEVRGGTGGRFLLVLRKESDGKWRKLFLHEERGSRGFSVLVSKGGRIYWGTCMQCEEFRRIVIGKSGAALE